MTKFKLSFYPILFEKENNSFEIIFYELIKQLEIYQRQFALTLKSYKKEWDTEILDRDKLYYQAKEAADKVYDSVFKSNGGDEFAHQYAMNQSGLDFLFEDHYSDTERINTEYNNFLDLYSKSILIALYSLNESKLNEIAETASETFTKKIKPIHFNSRDYLESSFQYLNLVIDIELKDFEKYITKLKDLQFLRNKIIHNESKFLDIDKVSKIVKGQKSVLSLDDKNHLKIKGSKFIKDIFELYMEFYQTLFWSIDIRQDSAILRNGFKHWLGILDREVVIEDLQVTEVSLMEKKIYFKSTFKTFTPHKLEFKINIQKGAYLFDFIDQTEDSLVADFLGYENDIKGKNVYDIFNSLMTIKNYQIKMIVF